MLAPSWAGLSFSAAQVEGARSGDLAWEHETYEFATTISTINLEVPPIKA